MKIKILSILILVYALYLFVLSAIQIISTINIMQAGVKTNGKIVSSYKEFSHSTQTSSRRYGTSHYIIKPIVHYSVNGSVFEIHGKILGEIGSEYKMGQSIPLLYLPNNPGYAKINSFLELWSKPLKGIVFSVFFTLFGIYLKSIILFLKQKLINLFQLNPFPSHSEFK
ncbi:DUF3592 domain-containing protein [Leptospira sp. WS39.C2]